MSRPTTPAIENWKPIAGFEALYEVSDLGRIRRLRGRQGTRAGRITSGRTNRDGYLRVSLCDAPNPEVEKLIHILVLEAFIGPCPDGMEACHWDGNPGNAALSNLRWDTPANNTLDKIRHGKNRGTKHWNARLSDHEVEQIRSATGAQRLIAAEFGIAQQTVSEIKRGRRRASVA